MNSWYRITVSPTWGTKEFGAFVTSNPKADPIIDSSGIRELSLTARLAIALHCFGRYCEKRDLHHPALNAFVDR
jgi:hypothetical protein